MGGPIIGLMLAVTGLFVGLLAQFAQTEDRTFAADSRQLVESAVRGRQQSLGHLTLDYAMWDEAYSSISRSWRATWIRDAYYSSIADALLIVHADGTVRYAWTAEGVDDGIVPALVGAFLSDVGGVDPRASDPNDLVRNGVFAFGDGIALTSVGAITPEDAAERTGLRPSQVDYLVAVDVLDASEISALGASLNLEDFSFVPRPTRAADFVTHPLLSADSTRSVLRWRHERPGTNTFAKLVWPIVAFLVLFGALAALVARKMVAAQIEALAQVQSAEENNRLRADFIASMSHEFRTPLNAVIGYAELIQEELTEEQRRSDIGIDVAHILKAAKHLLRLVNDILDHTRIDAGRLQLQIASLPIADVLASTEDLARPLALANNNRLVVVNEAGGLLVRADELRLRQCLINLVGNSLKFTSSGEVRLVASRDRQSPGTFVTFEVSDNGIGISKENLARLFQPFAQAEPAVQNKFGGAGLGLSISRKVAGAMGGTITAESEGEGRGATFKLMLPAVDAANDVALRQSDLVAAS